MCFSATASFVAGGVLAATGVLTLTKTEAKKELPLASIPLFFGIQQTIEGVIWLSFGMSLLGTVMTYAYLFFAYVFWPVFVPIAVLLVEPDPLRKNVLRALSLAGFILGAYLLYYIFADPGTAHIVNQSIAYDYRHLYELLPLTLYVAVTCGSGLISSHRVLNVFGLAALASFFIANWFFNITFISVWCFLAAILSAIIYWYFKQKPVAVRPVETG
ncbi:MAG: DUF6629 family protein [Patescibacteria group bacterium]